jgi:hypothetical protein
MTNEAAKQRVARFRARRRRFDYAPSDKALASLEQVARNNPSHSWSAIIDALVIKAVTGNAENRDVTE